MATEVEARFRADGREVLAELAAVRRLGSADIGPAQAFVETDTYLDTPAEALSAVRWACRLRRRGDRVTVSLKGPPEAPVTGAIHRRPEVEGPATTSPDPEDWPASPARDLLDRLRGGAALRERLTLRQERVERPVTLGGRGIATLSLDAVTVLEAGGTRGGFAVVELELAPGAEGGEEALHAVAAEIGTRAGLYPDGQTKLEHALELISRG